ncbi:PH domain-containing protein [Corynebacterium mycetoides]|uniref:PH domain-containing protein n=1 Tax=Corynebacterium mycetoides TaxID=38302 RepID=A0A1G9MIE7_9CORY|nr:PH domain-containing protein [Corynebacterium mycetoides]SDL73425.1 PH domain-containing protein [Corynebacterium mycetoides]
MTGNKLSDEELLRLYAADPHAVTSSAPWELEITSPFLRKVAAGWVVLVMAVHIFMAAVLDVEFTGMTFTPVDKIAFPGIGLIISVVSWICLTRPRVRVNKDGVEVRNIIGTRFYPWLVIYGLSFPRSARMARLELPEFEYVPLWAIQSGDGKRALEAVDKFRALEAEYMPES